MTSSGRSIFLFLNHHGPQVYSPAHRDTVGGKKENLPRRERFARCHPERERRIWGPGGEAGDSCRPLCALLFLAFFSM
jgi:hypothetical protein